VNIMYMVSIKDPELVQVKLSMDIYYPVI
jgi:hypothetical protein